MASDAASFILATACGGVFAGSALALSVFDVPALSDVDPAAVTQYHPRMIARAAPFQGIAAILGGVAAAVQGMKESNDTDKKLWFGAATALLAGWPWSIFVVFPINDQFKAAAAQKKACDISLLKKWGDAHKVRTVLGVAAFGLMLAAAYRRRS